MPQLVSVILPCRNEEKSIGECIMKIQACFDRHGIPGEIIVSDSSTDNSAKIAEELGVKVVKHGKEGYGYAYHAGFMHARGDIIVIGDADGTYDFEEMNLLLAKIGSHDLVVGSRLRGKILPGAMPWLHRAIGNPLLSFLLRLLFGSKIKDTQSGFRAIKRSAWEKLGLQASGMEFASEMLCKATILKLRVSEVPITYHPRKNGSCSKLRSFRDGWNHLRFMLLFMSGWLFLTPGFLLALSGAGLFFIGQSLLGMVLAVFGYQVILAGFFAKSYSYEHLNQPSFLADMINKHFLLGKTLFLAGAFLAASALTFWVSDIWVFLLVVGLQTFLFAIAMKFAVVPAY